MHRFITLFFVVVLSGCLCCYSDSPDEIESWCVDEGLEAVECTFFTAMIDGIPSSCDVVLDVVELQDDRQTLTAMHSYCKAIASRNINLCGKDSELRDACVSSIALLKVDRTICNLEKSKESRDFCMYVYDETAPHCISRGIADNICIITETTTF